jgi:hypothetical protein
VEPAVICLSQTGSATGVSLHVTDLDAADAGDVAARPDGSGPRTVVVAGPTWDGVPPAGTTVLRCPTRLCLVRFRPEPAAGASAAGLVGWPDELSVRALSWSAGSGDPAGAGASRMPPLSPAPPRLIPPVDLRNAPSVEFLRVLDWLLRLTPVPPGEERSRAELATIGLGGTGLDVLLDDYRSSEELLAGLRTGMHEVLVHARTAHRSGRGIGDRASFAGDHLARAAEAYLDILGVGPPAARSVIPRPRAA